MQKARSADGVPKSYPALSSLRGLEEGLSLPEASESNA